MGDGIIEIDELDINSGGGFTNGEMITISQMGATSGAGTFTNLGEIQTSELTITTSVDVPSASQNVTVIQGLRSVQGFWTDINSDINVDDGEIAITQQGVLFENGQVDIFGNVVQFTIATANFVDSEDDVINDGELSISNGGSHFTTGTVTLTGQTSSASTSAQFTDTNIACQAPNSGNWTITEDCTLFGNATSPGNMIVQNNSLVTVLNGVTLDIDFTNFNLTIKSGSGVLIKSGGAIT